MNELSSCQKMLRRILRKTHTNKVWRSPRHDRVSLANVGKGKVDDVCIRLWCAYYKFRTWLLSLTLPHRRKADWEDWYILKGRR